MSNRALTQRRAHSSYSRIYQCDITDYSYFSTWGKAVKQQSLSCIAAIWCFTSNTLNMYCSTTWPLEPFQSLKGAEQVQNCKATKRHSEVSISVLQWQKNEKKTKQNKNRIKLGLKKAIALILRPFTILVTKYQSGRVGWNLSVVSS